MQGSTGFTVIGISVRTTNENDQMAIDIPAIWGRFLEEKISERIPGKIDARIYCVYTDYEKDHTRPYTAILGCRVSGADQLPDGLVRKTIPAGVYIKQTARGNPLSGSVLNEWQKIWASDFARNFVADFEVYDERSQQGDQAEVDIFVGIDQ
jgi:predicted transcriptional regulator YdeE